MKVRALLLGLLLCPAVAGAQAPFLNGATLLEYLDEAAAGTSFSKQAIAMGYVSGVHDAMTGREVCADRSVSAKEDMEIVHRYLRSHRERLKEPAAALVAQALSAYFPCRK